MGNISKYENRVVAFVDILGFSSVLSKTQQSQNGNMVDNQVFIDTLVGIFNRVSELMGIDETPDDAAPSRMATQFSDSIVISFKVEESSIEFRYLLEKLIYLQIELLRESILLRGGISYGSLIHTQKVLFGPAMVHAYRVESLAANSPRIILPKSLTQINNLEDDFISRQTAKLNDIISIDEDDFYYLDYFDKCQNPDLGLFVDDSGYIAHLENMRKVIKEGLKNDNPGIYSKFGWMKSKFNKTLEKYRYENELNILRAKERTALSEYFEKAKPINVSM
jgi:hypothetical protein